MGSWVRTIRKMLKQQHGSKKASRHRRQSSGIVMAAHAGDVETAATSSSQLYGEVMACTYEDVQVMWSMLDNKARICGTDAAS